MQEENDLIILTKYIIGEASEEENLFINLWMSQDPARKALYIELKALWHGSTFYDGNEQIDVDSAYNLFRNKIDKPARITLLARLAKYKIAAMIAILLSIGGIILLTTGRKHEESTNYSQEIKVQKGYQKKVILSDSTVVWLNAASILRIDDGFGKTNRKVYLEGEGYFVVAHDQNLVFTINTKDYTVRDIGTSFNIKAYPSESVFETAVMEGKVAVEGKFSATNKVTTVFLTKNAVLKIKKEERRESVQQTITKDAPIVTLKNATNVNTYNYWKDDIMVFDDVSLKEISHELERKYNVVINIKDDSLNHYRYSGNFNKVPGIEQVLEIIQETTPLIYKLEGNTVTITRKTNHQISE